MKWPLHCYKPGRSFPLPRPDDADQIRTHAAMQVRLLLVLPCSCCCWHPHAVADVSFFVSPTTVSGFHALVCTHALASVSTVIGSTVTGVVALWQHVFLAVFRALKGNLFHSPMPENSGP